MYIRALNIENGQVKQSHMGQSAIKKTCEYMKWKFALLMMKNMRRKKLCHM